MDNYCKKKTICQCLLLILDKEAGNRNVLECLYDVANNLGYKYTDLDPRIVVNLKKH